MVGLRVKQALVWIISFAVGVALTLGIVYGYLETDLDTYSLKYFVLTVIFNSMILVIWGDFLLKADILPD